jgi:hypothetical protein
MALFPKVKHKLKLVFKLAPSAKIIQRTITALQLLQRDQ